ncbi:lymphoid-restricted membrane protein-like [Stylophora pistillata]|uniref:lymphoid-restricted membrane protein-like n=1 Tax=Stylophora pistillata TaxID=50429 RepID=UPI000C04C3CD|nr:lymphoid-restricted membrane protein-like [Stylophora pistillata]
MMDTAGPEKDDDPSKISDDADAVLDNFFYDCDKDNTGRVSVSKLIEYLRNAISSGTEEFAGSLDDLSLILDPDGKDMEIGLTSFQEGIKEWISEIRRQSYVNADDECPSPVAVNCMDSPEARSYGSPKRFNHVPDIPNASSDSVEGLGGTSPVKDWDSELMSTIETLQLNNKRLIEQQSAIQAQMENTEEGNNLLMAEVESLRKQLRSAQLTIEKNKGKEKENAELRQAVADAMEANQCLQTKITQLEKERTLHEGNLKNIDEKLLETQAQVELLEEERKRLVNDLAEQKQYCTDLEEIQGVKNDMIAKESSTNSQMMAGFASQNEALKREKGRLEHRVLELEDNLLRLKRSELSAEKNSLVQNGPAASSTPFVRQSSLQQEILDQETSETIGLPSPMVGSGLSLNDSLHVDDIDTSLTDLNQSWMSGVSLDSTGTTASFEKYSLTARQLAGEFNLKKEKTLKHLDELTALNRSVDVREKREIIREHLAREMDTFAEKTSSLYMKKKAAEKRTVKLLAIVKKLKEENKEFLEERNEAHQKLRQLALLNDENSAKLLELEGKHEQDRKTVTEQNEKLESLEQQLSTVSLDFFKARVEKESLSRCLENEKRVTTRLEDKVGQLEKNQDELESQQTNLLVQIKELESELVKATSQLSMEKRRTSSLEESIQMSISRHSDELKDIFEAIPHSDSELFNRSRQSPRCSSPCITSYMVRTRLYDFVSKCDGSKRMQGVGSDYPDQETTKTLQKEEALETFEDNDLFRLRSPSLSSDSLSPQIDRHESDDTCESPSGKFVQLVENDDRELLTTSCQTDLKELVSTGSQTELLRELQRFERELGVVDKGTCTEEDHFEYEKQRRRRSGIIESPGPEVRTLGTTPKSSEETPTKITGGDSSSGKATLSVEKDKTATNLWRKKLSVAFKIPEEFDYESATSAALENSVGGNNFVDGVSLRVRPALNDKEIEKQFKTLVLAFQTDHDTLNRRLEVQARAREIAESNMNKELQSMSNSLKEFEQLCFTKDMQDMLSLLKTHLEIIKKSSQRIITQTEQHGCVKQEARMSSGVEVMICHAENLTRHLERVREDLNDLRMKERLVADESASPGTLANGPTRLGIDSQTVSSPSSPLPHQSEGGGDGTKQNSLLNFVMAFHTTSMRAKEALRSFRRRTEASRQEREASASPVRQTEEPSGKKMDSSLTESMPEAESSGTPVVVVSDSEGENDNINTELREGTQDEHEDEMVTVHLPAESEGNDQIKDASENESESDVLDSEVNSFQETSKRPSVCWRFLSAAFRFTTFVVIFLLIIFIGVTIFVKTDIVVIERDFVMSRLRKLLDPFIEVVYHEVPPQ